MDVSDVGALYHLVPRASGSPADRTNKLTPAREVFPWAWTRGFGGEDPLVAVGLGVFFGVVRWAGRPPKGRPSPL